MKHFIFTYSERTPRNGHTVKTVKLYKIFLGGPVFLGEFSDTFVDKAQLVMEALKQSKALPKRYLERNEWGGSKYVPWSLKSEGIATLTEV